MSQFLLKVDLLALIFIQYFLGFQLEYTSFVAACLERQNYLEQTNLHDAFNRFRNEDGFITADSLRSILGDKFSTKEV